MGIRFCYDNLVDTADLTTLSEVTTLPVENIQDFRLGCKYRTTGKGTDGTPEYIVFNLGSAQSVNSIIVLGHNISSSVTTLKIQGHTSDSWGTPDVNIDLLDPQGGGGTYNVYDDEKIVWFFTSASKQYWRLIIADASNPDGYLEIGRVFLGTYFEPSCDAEAHIEIETNDMSDQNQALDGTEYFNIKEFRDMANLNFPIVDENDEQGVNNYQLFRDMYKVVGQHQDIIVSLYPDYGSNDTNRYRDLKGETYYCRFVGNFATVPLEGDRRRLKLKIRKIVG